MDKSNGRITSVLVEKDELGSPYHLTVWADKGLADVIKNVVGVYQVNISADSRYEVFVDKRFDVDFVSDEIIAAIKIISD
jgi:hypothetical protein